MQSVKKILADMGFNKEAPIETQKAFLKHLIAAANQTQPQSAQPKKDPAPAPARSLDQKPVAEKTQPNEQLEFNFSEDKRVS